MGKMYDKLNRVKTQAKKDMDSFNEYAKDKGYTYFTVELRGPSEGLHSWASPTVPYRLDANSKVLATVEQMTKDTKKIIGDHLTNADIKLLATATYISQIFANNLPKEYYNAGIMMASEVLKRAADSYPGYQKMEIRMTTMESPMSMIGIKGDKFIPGIGEADYIRLLDSDGKILKELNQATISNGADMEDVSLKTLATMLDRAMS